MAQRIYPPLPGVFGLWGHVQTPFFITPNGVISPHLFVEQFAKGHGHFQPALPRHGEHLDKIAQDLANRVRLPKDILKPTGQHGDHMFVPKPNLATGLKRGQGTIHLPSKEIIRPNGPRVLPPKDRGIDVDIGREHGIHWEQDHGRGNTGRGKGNGHNQKGHGTNRGQGQGQGQWWQQGQGQGGGQQGMRRREGKKEH